MEDQGFRDHVDLELFVSVLNRCGRRVNKTSAVTLLSLIADPLLGRAAVALLEGEVALCFWTSEVTREAIKRWIIRLMTELTAAVGAERQAQCSFLCALASLRIQFIADLLPALAQQNESVAWPFSP
jgi:hypothetical protein